MIIWYNIINLAMESLLKALATILKFEVITRKTLVVKKRRFIKTYKLN